MLSDINNPSIKHDSITSLPEEISVETFRLIKVKNKLVSMTSLEENFQHVLEVLEKLCSQHGYFKTLMKGIFNMKQGCKRSDLLIKCDDEKKCVCRTKKKKHFEKYKFSSRCFKGKPKKSYLRKKKFRGPNKSNRCYIFHKKRHYAKNYPNKAQSVKLVDFLAKKAGYNLEAEDVESFFFPLMTNLVQIL